MDKISKLQEEEGRTFNADERGVYQMLTDCGFTIGHTGGGCTAWSLDFPNCEVMVTQDAGHILEPDYMDYCGVSVGVYAHCSPIWEDGTTTYEGIAALVAVAMSKAMNYRPEEEEE